MVYLGCFRVTENSTIFMGFMLVAMVWFVMNTKYWWSCTLAQVLAGLEVFKENAGPQPVYSQKLRVSYPLGLRGGGALFCTRC